MIGKKCIRVLLTKSEINQRSIGKKKVLRGIDAYKFICYRETMYIQQ